MHRTSPYTAKQMIPLTNSPFDEPPAQKNKTYDYSSDEDKDDQKDERMPKRNNPKSRTNGKSRPVSSPYKPRTNGKPAPRRSSSSTKRNSSKSNPKTSKSATKKNTKKPRNTLKQRKFAAIYKSGNIEIDTLRKLSWSGIPKKYRPLTWKILLGYLPTNIKRHQAVLDRKRKEYRDTIATYYEIDVNTRTELDNDNIKQIEKDIPRVHSPMPLLREPIVQTAIRRILYIWSSKHPATGYVQGINDLITPFYIVFLTEYVDDDVAECTVEDLGEDVLMNIEADCYWCFFGLLEGIQDHYTADQPKLQHMLFDMKKVIHAADKRIHDLLAKYDIDYMHFAFKWMNNLLLREIPLPLIPRLWDTYLSENDGFNSFHVFVCAAFLLTFKTETLTREREILLMLLQKLPTQDWTEKDIEMLLSESFLLQTRYSEAHLQTIK